jgi:hypothetical protein
MDEDDFSEDYEYMDEPEMKPEMGAFERAGGTGILGSKIDISELKGKKMEEIAKKLSRVSMSPEERLKIYVDALSRKFNDDGVVKITNENIDEMLSYVSSLTKPQYTNPIGFIMGYVATNGGLNMKEETVKKVIRATEKLKDDGGFGPNDVIRYSSLWLNLRK